MSSAHDNVQQDSVDIESSFEREFRIINNREDLEQLDEKLNELDEIQLEREAEEIEAELLKHESEHVTDILASTPSEHESDKPIIEPEPVAEHNSNDEKPNSSSSSSHSSAVSLQQQTTPDTTEQVVPPTTVVEQSTSSSSSSSQPNSNDEKPSSSSSSTPIAEPVKQSQESSSSEITTYDDVQEFGQAVGLEESDSDNVMHVGVAEINGIKTEIVVDNNKKQQRTEEELQAQLNEELTNTIKSVKNKASEILKVKDFIDITEFPKGSEKYDMYYKLLFSPLYVPQDNVDHWNETKHYITTDSFTRTISGYRRYSYKNPLDESLLHTTPESYIICKKMNKIFV